MSPMWGSQPATDEEGLGEPSISLSDDGVVGIVVFALLLRDLECRKREDRLDVETNFARSTIGGTREASTGVGVEY